MSAQVLVTHPGRQHSHQAALGLCRAGLLAAYWSGVPSVASHGAWVPRVLWRWLVRHSPVDLPPGRTRLAAWAPGLRRLGGSLLPRPLAAQLDFLACRLFDAWAAASLGRVAARAVLACEISALATFRAARRRGWTTLLDAPSLHHSVQDRLHGFTEPVELHRRIARVKDEEIDLADHILTVSPLARASYIEAGVRPERVHALGLGADLALFEARDAAREPGGRFRFVFCGAPIRRKGFDVLVGALRRAFAQGLDAELRVAGGRGDAAACAHALPPDRVRLLGPLTQAALASELRGADCLVLPSRSDSFGMVVVEALACGVPVLVSDQVGARELVDAGTGVVVPAGDEDALCAALLDLACRRPELRRMTAACRRAALSASWERYHESLADLVQRLVPQ
jgi:glycosyltransferase involved in cell wall biosynthesis